MSDSCRLDQHLVRAGLARSRTQAQRLIRAGEVTVDGHVTDKPSYAVLPGQQVNVTDGETSRWVGRGALKLLHALHTWQSGSRPDERSARTSGAESGRRLRVAGRRCLDVGASTGGFTQVLLEHGAAHVTALDVGHGQLVESLAADRRVTEVSGTNIREVGPGNLGTFELVVGDLSFISLTLVLPVLVPLLEQDGDVVLLIKPQFEVGRERLGRGGVVTSPAERARALGRVIGTATGLGWNVHGVERSPVLGAHGNTEYLLWLATSAPGMMSPGGTTARIRELTGESD
ncbi:TlyA family RNA methyltransferase [Ornithinimicrobium cavernae]|uniref:TlyA family RNA methyltransferase n=1 Tax=Ornithinimicrobium cavernae TaxID=2666047 RepID=UPI000D69672D|nr:TlyA family RNA methyltransferase [Ornithinimicrobium cavernae]